MEASLEQKDILSNKKLLNKIKDYARLFNTQESCGLIIEKSSSVSFIECENLSENPKYHFKIDPKIFIENKVLYVYHSHVDCTANPSSQDMLYSNELCVPFLIYSIRYDEFKIYKNISV